MEVSAAGMLGGHSGLDIENGRANAVKVLAAALREAYDAVPFGLVSLDGGKSRNAIPRDARALCAVASDHVSTFRDGIATAGARIRSAYTASDPGVQVSVDRAPDTADRWPEETTRVLLDAVALLPSGPLAMSPDVAGLVETSSSLGEAVTEGSALTLHSLSRSSNDPALPEVIATIDATARLARGTLEVKHNYAGWRPNVDSPVLSAAQRVYKGLFGADPVVTGVHAGLETAVIGSKVPGLDMLSFGPQIEFPHSPDERVSIPTVERFWKLLVALLDELSGPGR